MSRSAAARTHHDHDHDQRALRRPRPHGAAHARRVSGPAHPAAHSAQPRSAAQAHAQMRVPAYAPPRPRMPIRATRPQLRLAAGSAAIALRVAESALEVSGSRTMDRLVRSRAWVVIIGVGLIGIVAMQVSMLKLNAGIGRAVETMATLERSNAALKGEVSRLSSGDRIQAHAGQRGFVMPEPADVTYLRAGDKRSDGARAARVMRAPDPLIAGPAGAATAVPDALTQGPGGTPGSPGVAGGASTTAPAVTAPETPATPTASPPVTAVTASTPATPSTPSAPPATTAAVRPAPTAPQTTSAGGVTPP
ncbi:MAG: hypothetical protein KY463_01390 [Actinobacteria bacterium]|nr:hypothetical protein [Actinomycetota bacterium]